MASERRLVLDANIHMRAVLGRRVRQIIEAHVEHATFCAPDVAIGDAQRHLPDVVRKRGGGEAAVAAALDVLDAVARNVDVIEAEAYESHRPAALARIAQRDPDLDDAVAWVNEFVQRIATGRAPDGGPSQAASCAAGGRPIGSRSWTP